MTGYNSGRGGKREGSGRKATGSNTVVIRVSKGITKDEAEAIPSIKTAMASWYEEIEKEPLSPRYHFLKQFLGDIEALGIKPE